MKRLILFVHGLGGSDETWGHFPNLIKNDKSFKDYDVELFTYKTSLIDIKSGASLLNKIISFFFPLSMASKISSVLSIIVPQNRLPKIQHVADLLKTDIEELHRDYDEIYLITHSMGGLVARKYLYDIIKSKNILKIKKLMLYAVPNNGSKWAKLVSLYSHYQQVAQLDGDSDFIELLNEQISDIDLDEHLYVLYIIGDEDEIVSRSSAKSFHGNKKTKFLPKGHIDIVKPKDTDDRSYIVFKNFICDTENFAPAISNKIVEDIKKNPFVENVEKILHSKRLLTLFSQDFTDISTQQALVKQKMQYLFQDHFYHLRIPQFLTDEAKYFSSLSHECGFKKSIDKIYLWKKEVANLLENSSKKICFYITGIEDSDIELSREFAKAIRSLKEEFPNFHIVVIGRKKLASLVYGKDSKLSPLNTAEWIFFDDTKETITTDKIKQEFQNLKSKGKSPCPYLDDDIEIDWTYYSEYTLNTLFWRNILKNRNNKYSWRDETTKEIAKEIFQC